MTDFDEMTASPMRVTPLKPCTIVTVGLESEPVVRSSIPWSPHLDWLRDGPSASRFRRMTISPKSYKRGANAAHSHGVALAEGFNQR